MPSARRMSAAAMAEDGLRAIARLIASSNVTRSVGCGTCATSAEHEIRNATSANPPLRTCPPHSFYHDVEHQDEGQIQEGCREHPAGDGGANRMTRFLSGAAGKHQRHHAEDEGQRGHQ